MHKGKLSYPHCFGAFARTNRTRRSLVSTPKNHCPFGSSWSNSPAAEVTSQLARAWARRTALTRRPTSCILAATPGTTKSGVSEGANCRFSDIPARRLRAALTQNCAASSTSPTLTPPLQPSSSSERCTTWHDTAGRTATCSPALPATASTRGRSSTVWNAWAGPCTFPRLSTLGTAERSNCAAYTLLLHRRLCRSAFKNARSVTPSRRLTEPAFRLDRGTL